MIEALKASLGVISTACENVGISRQTHYRWLTEDESYKEQAENITEAAVDFAESKLFERIKGVTVQNKEGVYDQPPSDTAIIFYLKTKGKKRGYIERQELLHDVSNVFLNLDPLADAPSDNSTP
jgi:hypothetical protein